MKRLDERSYRQPFYDLVRRIPRGKVMTYGSVAIVLGEGYTPRTVGYVMHGSPDGVPWQRVINSQGKTSTARLTIPINLQQELLEAEGIIFSPSGKCDLSVYQWWPEGYANDEDVQTKLFETTDKRR